MLNIFKLTGTASGYGIFDAIVVIAKTAEEAQQIHPEEDGFPYPSLSLRAEYWEQEKSHCVWAQSPAEVKAEWIGRAIYGFKPGIVLVSFIAG